MKEENFECADVEKRLKTGERGLLQMFMEDVRKMQLLSQEEEMAVAWRSRAGDGASRNHLAESNTRFVLKVVFQYWSPGLPLMDMISEGCVGLTRAAKTFDPDKGYRFLTYAGYSIAQGVIKAIKEHNQYGHESIDELIYDDGSDILQKDVLVSKEQPGDETAFYNQIQGLLDRLNDRERTIITLRFWQGLTLEEIGLRVNATKETVRRVEVRALRKLRLAIEGEDTTLTHQVWGKGFNMAGKS